MRPGGPAAARPPFGLLVALHGHIRCIKGGAADTDHSVCSHMLGQFRTSRDKSLISKRLGIPDPKAAIAGQRRYLPRNFTTASVRDWTWSFR